MNHTFYKCHVTNKTIILLCTKSPCTFYKWEILFFCSEVTPLFITSFPQRFQFCHCFSSTISLSIDLFFGRCVLFDFPSCHPSFLQGCTAIGLPILWVLIGLIKKYQHLYRSTKFQIVMIFSSSAILMGQHGVLL